MIERYYIDCPLHARSDEGPLCYENECSASPHEKMEYQRLRDERKLDHFLKEKNITKEEFSEMCSTHFNSLIASSYSDEEERE